VIVASFITMKKLVAFLLMAGLLPSSISVAETDLNKPVRLVVSANKIEEPLEKTSSSVVVIDRKTIEASQRQTVAEILRTVPGIDVVSSGGPGGNTSIFIRGANSEHTLVLLNGVEINNPASTSRLYNFANLSLNNVEKIEIVLGPGSSLYGSDAIGGVINIFTRDGSSEDSNLLFASEAGSQSTFNNNALASFREDNLSGSFYAERMETEAFSAQDNPEGPAERDAYDNTIVGTNLNYKLDQQHNLKSFIQYSSSNAAIDDGVGLIPDDPNHNIDSSELTTRLEAQGKYKTFQHKLGVSYARHLFKDQDSEDLLHSPETIDSRFSGRLIKADYLGTLDLNKSNKLIVGFETEQEAADSDSLYADSFGTFDESFHPDSIRTNSAYTQLSSQVTETLSSSQGIRFDSNQQAGDEFTYKVSPRYELTKSTAVRAGWATGFKAPSLYQLYSPYGEPNLEAETSRGWEAAITQSFWDSKAKFELGYFENKIDNMIDFDSQTFVFNNLRAAKLSGINSSVNLDLDARLSTGVSYAYLDAEDQDLNSSLLRRARHRLSHNLNYQISEKFKLGSELVLVGRRFDNDFSTFPAERRSLASYTIVNLLGTYSLNDTIDLKARIENLFDRSYEDVYGFNRPGLLAFAGIEIRI
jgi:vitamin B12 transporter